MSNEQTLRWVEPFAYKAGQPFRILPVGEFKRGNRKLTITPERLQAFADNLKQDRPRWKPPIYFGHPTDGNPDPQKVGNVVDLVVKSDGLYAVPEYTEIGEKAVAEGGYQYNSPGVIWDLNGAEYTDEHGQKFNNVLDHVALTNKPWFGSRTQIFSAEGVLTEDLADNSDAHLSAMKRAWKKAQGYMAQLKAMFEGDEGWMTELPEGKKPMVDGGQPMADVAVEVAAALKDVVLTNSASIGIKNTFSTTDGTGTATTISGNPQTITMTDVQAETPTEGAETPSAEALERGASPDTTKGEDTMSDKTQAEAFAITPEEFAAVKAKAEKADALESEMKALRQQNETFAAEAAKEKDARRMEQLLARCEQFNALAVPAVELAASLHKLEKLDAELFKYFEGVLAHADKLAGKAELFSQRATTRTKPEAENFADYVEKVLKEKFSGDRTKYGEAFQMAGTERPDLFSAYERAA